MQLYIPWTFVTFILGFFTCIATILLLSKAAARTQKRKMTATQERYKTALATGAEDADGKDRLHEALDELQKQIEALKGDHP